MSAARAAAEVVVALTGVRSPGTSAQVDETGGRPLEEIEADIQRVEKEIVAMLQLKERAMRKLDPLGPRTRRFKADSLPADLPGEPLIMESAGRPRPRPPPTSSSAACHNAELVMMVMMSRSSRSRTTSTRVAHGSVAKSLGTSGRLSRSTPKWAACASRSFLLDG